MAVKKTTKKAKTKKATTPERKITAVKEPMTKPVILNEIAGNTGLTKKQVSSVFDELAVVIERHIKKRSPGQFVLPGLLKVEVKSSRVVKVRPLKGLKDMVER